MEIGFNIKNMYMYAVASYAYNEGKYPNPANADTYRTVATGGEQFEDYVKDGESAIVEIPGMGEVLIQFLGETKLADYHQDGGHHTPFDTYKCSALIRFNSVELYWRFDYEGTPNILFTINRYGTLELNKVTEGEVRTISLPQVVLPVPTA